jgi:hypothetical protein
VDPQDDPRETGKQPIGEKDTVWEYLRRYRMTLELKCSGLDPAAQRSVPPSMLSRLGLLRHLAKVEQQWFRQILQGQDLPRRYHSDTDTDSDSARLSVARPAPPAVRRGPRRPAPGG